MNWYLLQTKQFGYPQPENDFGYITETYDVSGACRTCNIGLIQRNEFRFGSDPKANHGHILGLNWVFDQIFVKQPVKEKFESEAITGITFSQPVLHKTGLPIDGLYQLRIDNLLKDGLLTDNLKTEICEKPKDKGTLKFLTAIKSNLIAGPFCGQKKYNFPQGENKLKIKTDSLVDKSDFIRLDYYFGSGGSANRPILISERVKDLIEKEKWRGAFFQEVELI